jgi:hypothetical protein
MTLREIFEGTSVTDRLLTLFNGLLVAVNIYLVIIIGSQLNVMHKDEQAWIYPQVVGTTNQTVNTPIKIQFNFPNVGKTPAKHFEIISRIEILDASQEPTFDYSNKLLNNWFYAGLAVPNHPVPGWVIAKRQVSGTQTTEEIAWTQTMLDEYNAGRLWLSAEGVLTYQDVFDVWHHVRFCYETFNRMQPTIPPGERACIEYNDGD